jgi:hypothetical protein
LFDHIFYDILIYRRYSSTWSITCTIQPTELTDRSYVRQRPCPYWRSYIVIESTILSQCLIILWFIGHFVVFVSHFIIVFSDFIILISYFSIILSYFMILSDILEIYLIILLQCSVIFWFCHTFSRFLTSLLCPRYTDLTTFFISSIIFYIILWFHQIFLRFTQSFLCTRYDNSVILWFCQSFLRLHQ